MQTDLISRSAVLAMMDKYIDMAKDEEMHHAMCVVAEGINDLPAVDAVPVVHAVWIGYWIGDAFKPVYRCSNCDRLAVIEKTNYCPKCGARMDGDADE